MSASGNDFEAAKAVADQLKGMEKDRQERILRWVAESLNINVGALPASDNRLGDAVHGGDSPATHGGEGPHRRQQPVTDIKSFVESKKPKSDVQFAAVVAYYYRFEAPAESRKDSIDAETLREAARLASRRRPPKPLMTMNNAKNLGYLDRSERGQFRINSVGENLVAMTLPGNEAEHPGTRSRSTGGRRKTKSRRR